MISKLRSVTSEKTLALDLRNKSDLYKLLTFICLLLISNTEYLFSQASAGSASNTGPSWSPDGRKITFYSDRDGNYEIYIMKADAGVGVGFGRELTGDFIVRYMYFINVY